MNTKYYPTQHDMNDRRAVGSNNSNRRFINSLPNKKFAEFTISRSQRPDYVYNYDEEPELWGFIDVFITSDGNEFEDWDTAVNHETWWLDQTHKETE